MAAPPDRHGSDLDALAATYQPSDEPEDRPATRRRLLAGALVGLVAAAVTWPVAPQSPALGEAVTGDPALAEQVADLMGPGGDRGVAGVAVALVAEGEVTTAALGHADAAGEVALRPDTPMEIGSVTKPLTGMLLADLASDGVVALDDAPAALLGVDDPALAGMTLEDLATHRSGLPREAISELTGPARFLLSGGNLYEGYDVERTIAAAEGFDLDGDHDPAYSNLGFSVLGQALAAAEGTTYPELLDDRLVGPLGLQRTTVATTPEEVPSDAATGWFANGVRPAPWTTEGLAPAGAGPWSTADDLGALLRAVIDGDAPGLDALEPRASFDDEVSVGLGWLRIDAGGGGPLLQHDGGTGGFLTYVGVQPDAARGVAVIASTDFLMAPNSVVPLGQALLDGDDAVADGPMPDLALPGLAFAVVLLLAAVGPTVRLAVRRRRRGRVMDRIDVAGSLVPVVLGLALARTIGGWQLVPGPWWSVAVAVGLGAVAACAVGWRSLSWASGERRWLRWTSAAVRAVVAALLVAAVF